MFVAVLGDEAPGINYGDLARRPPFRFFQRVQPSVKVFGLQHGVRGTNDIETATLSAIDLVAIVRI